MYSRVGAGVVQETRQECCLSMIPRWHFGFDSNSRPRLVPLYAIQEWQIGWLGVVELRWCIQGVNMDVQLCG
jgi:hypothetical protein